ncbi:MAG: hypothetical protein OYG31_00415 [Candidatus Kaiserbacteria bacterium]|nr:hypothetical protein [Candidatus Kaiserbacteria bacterium]
MAFVIFGTAVSFSQAPSSDTADEGVVLVSEEEESVGGADDESTVVSFGTLASFAVTIILAIFLWNLAKFVLLGRDSEEKQRGKEGAFTWLIALVLFASAWGAIAFVRNSLSVGEQGKGPITIPKGTNTGR